MEREASWHRPTKDIFPLNCYLLRVEELVCFNFLWKQMEFKAGSTIYY